MATAVREITLRVDLATAEALWSPEDVVLYYGDSGANLLRFDLSNNGQAVDASQYEAMLILRRPDGVLVSAEAGLVDGLLACLLPSACYERTGALGCVLRLTKAQDVATAVCFSLALRASPDGGASGFVENQTVNMAELQALKRQMELQLAGGVRVLGVRESPEDLEDINGTSGDAFIVGRYLYLWTEGGWARGALLDARDGQSAYALAMAHGFSGDEEAWLASLHGRDGHDGADGKDGAGFTEDTVFTSLHTQDKTLPGAVNELYEELEGASDLLSLIHGEEPEGGGL